MTLFDTIYRVKFKIMEQNRGWDMGTVGDSLSHDRHDGITMTTASTQALKAIKA
jgi:hypothetical protein